MKEHKELELSVYRMLKSELQKFQADKGVSYEITDDDVVTLVGRLVKQRKEAAEQYKAVGATDRAQAELDEIKVLEAYLPKQLDAAKLEKSSGKPSSKSARQVPKIWEK